MEFILFFLLLLLVEWLFPSKPKPPKQQNKEDEKNMGGLFIIDQFIDKFFK